MELESFDDISEVYCRCLGLSTISAVEKCFIDDFSKFNLTFENVMPIADSSSPNPAVPIKVVVNLESMNKYYISKDMSNIKFNLIFDYFEDGKSSDNLAFCSSSVVKK
jgi:hypothetical protein